MRIKVSVNAEEKYIAALSSYGYLGAHINLSNRASTETVKHKMRVIAHDTSSDSENVTLSWPEIELHLGDAIEIQLLENGDGDEPSRVRRTTELASNLFSNIVLAEEAILAGKKFESELIDILKKAQAIESDEESTKIRRAVGHLLAALGEHLYSPIWRRHSDLIPDAMKGELL